MMPAISITALLALVPGVALGANLNLRSNDVAQYATSASPPTIHAGRRLHDSDDSDDSDDSADNNNTEGSYVGCFRDNLDSSVLKFGFISGETTVEGCSVHCTESGASFMGLKYGFQCSCGFGEEDEFTLNGPGACPYECSGGGSSSCGGVNAFALYSLGENSPEPVGPMTPSPTASTGFPSTGFPLTGSPTTTYTWSPTSGPSSSPTSSPTIMGMSDDFGYMTAPPTPSRPATPMPVATTPPLSSPPAASPTPSPVVPFNPEPTTPPVTAETPSPVTPEMPSPVTTAPVATPSPVAPVEPLTPAPVAPVSPPTQPSPGSPTPADMEELLDLHNEARCIHNADPLTWSSAVASSAAVHAQKLMGDCGELYHSESDERNGYGENLHMCWGSDTCYSAAGAMQGLYNEEVEGFSKVTEYGGHATQILWKSTEELGCVVSKCTTGGTPYTYLVCQYDPPGNYNNRYEEEVGLPTNQGSC